MEKWTGFWCWTVGTRPLAHVSRRRQIVSRWGGDFAKTNAGPRLAAAILAGLVFFVAGVAISLGTGRSAVALPLLGSAIVLESQPAAAASLALGFHPLTGALLSILGNLVVIPLFMVLFRHVAEYWSLAKRLVARATKWSARYGRYGVPVLTVLSPFVGAYVALAMGFSLGWRRWTTLIATLVGMVSSTLAITYGGHAMAGLFLRL